MLVARSPPGESNSDQRFIPVQIVLAFGAVLGIRTLDLLFTKQLLYR
jgi:hypothetical protein